MHPREPRLPGLPRDLIKTVSLGAVFVPGAEGWTSIPRLWWLSCPPLALKAQVV
jgi:hypothetical protein